MWTWSLTCSEGPTLLEVFWLFCILCFSLLTQRAFLVPVDIHWAQIFYFYCDAHYSIMHSYYDMIIFKYIYYTYLLYLFTGLYLEFFFNKLFVIGHIFKLCLRVSVQVTQGFQTVSK